MTIADFAESPQCSKCGSGDVNWAYTDAKDHKHECGLNPHCPRREHFDMHCRRCHYEWSMEIRTPAVAAMQDTPASSSPTAT